jgi:hypothetical protein
MQISIEGESEFSRRPIGSENSGDKKTKQKAARRVRLFWLLFWRSKKVTSRRATPGSVIPSSEQTSYERIKLHPHPNLPPSRGKGLNRERRASRLSASYI